MNKTIYILAAIMAAMLTGIASAADDGLDSFVSKDKVWHYNSIQYEGGVIVSENVGPSLRFLKEDIIRNGTKYSVLVETDPTGEMTDTVALFRQDGGKLFLLNNVHLNKCIRTENGFGDPECLDKEFLAFDFDAKAGDIYSGFVCGDRGCETMETCIKSTDTVVVNGIEYRQQVLCRARDDHGWEIVAIEGIGVSGPLWWFFAPCLGDRLDEGRLNPHGEYVLREVTDLDGNVIFKYKDFGPGAGVDEIRTDDKTRLDRRMYDLNGREIRNPEPGTVYIQGCRKHVAPRR